VGREYTRIIHGFLLSSDVKEGRLKFTPGIATKWELSSDGLTWNLTIGKGGKFHDGKELTVEDVLWSLQHMIGPQAKDYSTGALSVLWSNLMDRIEQTGPERVSVTTKTPAPEFWMSISEAAGQVFPMGAVFPKRATLHDEKEAAAYDRNPIGAGIMRLVKHVPVDSMIFERFADYYHQPKNGFPTDKRVNFTRLELRVAPEEATRVAALRAGEVDMAPVNLGARKQVEAGGGRLVFVEEGTSLSVQLVGCWKPQFPCHDRRVRQALNYAIDKKVMQGLFGGPEVMQIKGWSEVTPSTIGYSPELDPFPFDPVKARQLLADAGYPDGKGFGKLVINTIVSTVFPLQPESAQLGAEFWRRELGLDVEVKVGDSVALSRAWGTTDALDGQVYWRDYPTRIDYSALARNLYLRPRKAGLETNSNIHNDPELFALVQKALNVFDPVEQEKILTSTYRRLRDEAHAVNLGYLSLTWGVGPRIQTWRPYPLGSYITAPHTITLK
jgi:peptide/nickel transport system substrate-binding protein